MRIVAGTHRGRTIAGPKWDGLRPTSDALRETLFNVLGPTLDGARVLDVFAGTGAVGLEALSRGARYAAFVERDPRAITLIEQNISKLGVENACAMIRADFMASRPLKDHRALAGGFDLIFLDPPYELLDLDTAVRRAATLLARGGRLVLEHSRRREAPESGEDVVAKYRTLTAGDSALSFYTAGTAMHATERQEA